MPQLRLALSARSVHKDGALLSVRSKLFQSQIVSLHDSIPSAQYQC